MFKLFKNLFKFIISCKLNNYYIVRLSYSQAAILLGMGLQHKSVE
jgi:hypothetical protein